MDEPLLAQTRNELPYYLRATSCPACGGGPLTQVRSAAAKAAGRGADPDSDATVRVRCRKCGARRTLHFRWLNDVPPDAEEADFINPTAAPSRIVDLAQWVSLCSLFADSAEKAQSPVEARALACQAGLCLAEALKFHADGELPPDSAFFHESSVAASRANPANYTRTRLQELKAALPTPAHRSEASGESRPSKSQRRAWWKFWPK